MPKLNIITSQGDTRSIRLEGDCLTVGRTPGNTLFFPNDDALSRQHLVFAREGDRWTVADRGSKNGTMVNGCRIGDAHLLQPGDRIAAGGMRITYEGAPTDAQTVRFETSSDPHPGTGVTSTLQQSVLSSNRTGRQGDAAVTGPSLAGAVWAFVRVGRELANRRPLPELFKTILDLSLEAVGAERGVLLTLDEKGYLVAQASSGDEFRISTTVRDKILNERASLLLQDVGSRKVSPVSELTVRQGVTSLMAVPLQTDENVIGLIYVDSLRSGRTFTEDDLNLLTVMANVAGIHIERERWEQQRRILVTENVTVLERLAAALSHEFNSPLGVLKSTLDTLLRVSAKQELVLPTDRPQLAALEASLRGTLDAAIDRMTQVIGRIQRFTNLDRSEIRLVNLNELLNDVVALSETQSSDPPIEVDVVCESLPPVMCRPQQLNLVFSSLLSNALEACRHIGDRPGKIRISARARGGVIDVQLQDNGRGIPSEELSHIFEPGFRVDRDRMAAGNWTLFSSRQMVREQGGDVRVFSKVGEGTTIVVTLPVPAC